MNKFPLIGIILGASLLYAGTAAGNQRFTIEESLNISRVPSDFPVGFCLLTEGKCQYVAYYNERRRMTVAMRILDSKQWQYHTLPSVVEWDSHNYITMALDSEGHLHVAGNMHGVKLIYFLTEKPGDITTLMGKPMTGKQEDRVTYPKFLKDHEGRLIFNYRNGGSGKGMRIFNKYDPVTRTWSRLLDKPLLDGEGKRNAYPLGPIRGSDGLFHLVWVWRDTPDCATNHHLSYARSRDLVHWESVFGRKVGVSMVLSEKKLWVDPIPSHGGIINGCEKLFLDAENRPIITYHKTDMHGNMQIYAARPEGTEWNQYVLTDWSKPIKFSGNGSMPFIGIRISGFRRAGPGILTMTYRHRDYGRGQLVIDEKSLLPLNMDIEPATEYPMQLNQVQSNVNGMRIRRAEDLAKSDSSDVRYLLQWETLGPNRDRPRKPPLPAPGMLRLYKLSVED